MEPTIGATAPSPSKSLILEADWLHHSERRDLPQLLAYLAQMSYRATLELPGTRFNDEPMDLFAAFGSAVFEREHAEPVGATRAMAQAFADGGGNYLLLDDVRPFSRSVVTRPFMVSAPTSRILVTALITASDGVVTLLDPAGNAVPLTRRSAKAVQWEVDGAEAGTWRIQCQGTLRTRLFVQDLAPDPSGADYVACLNSGETVCPTERDAAWQLHRVTPDGLRLARQGSSRSHPHLDAPGLYSLTTVRETGVIRSMRRRGFVLGQTRPILFSYSPSGILSSETQVRAAYLGITMPGSGSSTATVCGESARVTVVPKGEEAGVAMVELVMERGRDWVEGVHTVHVNSRCGDLVVEDSWTFIYDPPGARDLRITEVHPEEKWIELQALRDIPNLAVFALSDLDSSPVTLPEVALKSGDRYVVRYQRSTARLRVPHAVLSTPLRVSGRDQIAITRGIGDDWAIVDAIVIDDGKETQWSDAEKVDLALLESRGEWSGAPVATGGAFASVGRGPGPDGNNAADWREFYYPTPGQPEARDASLEGITSARIRIAEVGIWDPSDPWVELEILGGPLDLLAFSLTDMDGAEKRLGDAPRMVAGATRVLVRFGGWEHSGNSIRIPGRPPAPLADQVVLKLGSRVIDGVSWRTPGHPTRKDELRDMRAVPLTTVEIPSQVPGTISPSLAREGVEWKWSWFPSPGTPSVNIPRALSAGSLRILAVNPCSFQADWAEIICLRGPVDVSRCVLTDMDGIDHPLADAPVTLRTGDTILVKWGDGIDEVDALGDVNRNRIREIYLPNDQSLSSTDDQLVLVYGSEILDAVVFTNGDGTMSSKERQDCEWLVARGAWVGSSNQDGAVNVGMYRLPIERIDPQRNSNSRQDWRSRTPATPQEVVSR